MRVIAEGAIYGALLAIVVAGAFILLVLTRAASAVAHELLGLLT